MEKIKENIKAFLCFLMPLLVCIPMGVWYKNRCDEKSAERRKQRDMENQVEYFSRPLVKNEDSFWVGRNFNGASVWVDEYGEEVQYYNIYDTREEGMRVFDSLYVEICKHHCNSIATHRFTNKYNREFKCSNAETTITLRCGGRYAIQVEVCYDIL